MENISDQFKPRAGATSYSGLYGKAPPERGILKGSENRHFSVLKGRNIRCKVKEVAAKPKYIKGCQNLQLAEITTGNT